MKDVGRFYRHDKVALTYREDNRLVLPRTDLGVEFEWEGVKTPARILEERFGKLWKENKESSLHDNGKEFALRVPMFGEDLLNTVESHMAFAKEQGWKISLRTGLHIHMDCRDVTHNQLIGKCVHYTIWEPAIYAWVGGGREANNFCAPWYKCEGTIIDAAKLLAYIIKMSDAEGDQLEDMSMNLAAMTEDFHKYAGMNLRPLKQYGSVEFRHMVGTLSFEKVLSWINIILNLKRAALESPESSMAIIGLTESKGLDKQLVWMFGEKTAQEMLAANPHILEEVRTVGIPNAVEFLGALTETSSFIDNTKIYNGKMSKGAARWLAKKEEPAEERKPPPKLSGLSAHTLAIDEYAMSADVWNGAFTANIAQQQQPASIWPSLEDDSEPDYFDEPEEP